MQQRRNHSPALSWQTFSAMALAAVLASGCNKSPSEPLAETTGMVSFQGKPLTEGTVLFQDLSQGINTQAKIGADGKYVVERAQGFGLPPGNYKVAIQPPLFVAPVSAGPPPPAKEYPNIPEKYRNPESSGLTATIKDGENELNFDMQGA
jgi:hypothetical protein